MYAYYVSYIATKKTQQGPGYALIEREEPIRTGRDIENLAKDIKKKHRYSGVTILSWNPIESIN